LFLPDDLVVQRKMNFSITKYREKDMVKKIISKASSSWHFSTLAFRDGHIESSIKNVFHALRILEFGLQLKEHKKIVNYSSMNELKKELYGKYNIFNPRDYYNLFMEYQEKLKNDIN